MAIASLNNYSHTAISNTFYAGCERILDIGGYIPGISSTTAAMREVIAAAQLIHGFVHLAIGVFSHIGQAAIGLKKDNPHLSDGTMLLRNSFMNSIRASIEAVPFLGSFICVIFDLAKSRVAREDLAIFYGAKVIDVEIHRPVISSLI